MPNLEEVRGIDWKVSTLQKLMSMIDIFEMWKWQRKWFSFMSTTQLCASIVVFGPKVRQSDNCNMILNKRFDQPVLRHCIALFYKKKTSETISLMATGINSQQRSIFYRNVNEKIRHNAYPVSLCKHTLNCFSVVGLCTHFIFYPVLPGAIISHIFPVLFKLWIPPPERGLVSHSWCWATQCHRNPQ